MQTRTGTQIIRTCDTYDCHENLVVTEDQPITEQFAIELAGWMTVAGERVTPNGIVIDVKHFCSVECLKIHIDPLVAEYMQAEDRVLGKMTAEQANRWMAQYTTDYPVHGVQADAQESFDQLPSRPNTDIPCAAGQNIEVFHYPATVPEEAEVNKESFEQFRERLLNRTDVDAEPVPTFSDPACLLHGHPIGAQWKSTVDEEAEQFYIDMTPKGNA